MSRLVGSWSVDLKAQMGVMNVVFEFHQEGSIIQGSMTAREKSWPFHDIEVGDVADGERARWTMTMREPMRAKVTFDVTVRDDSMTGQGRANVLLRARVTGKRIET